MDFTEEELQKIDRAEESLNKMNINVLATAKRLGNKILLLNTSTVIGNILPEEGIPVVRDKFSNRYKNGMQVIITNQILAEKIEFVLGYNVVQLSN